MNILFFTTRLPFPPHRGDKIKTFNILRRLGKNHKIHLVTLLESKAETKHIKNLESYCKQVTVIGHSRINSILSIGISLFKGEPLQVGYFKNAQAAKTINKLLHDSYDIAYIHLIRSAPYFLQQACFPLVLDQTDAMTLYWRRRTNQAPLYSPKKYLYGLEHFLIKKYESKVIPNFNRCLTCSTKDLKVLKELAPGAKFEILPNGLDMDRLPFAVDSKYNKNTIVYLGNMSYAPNIDGVLYFYSYIFPLIKRKINDARLVIVGNQPPAKIKCLAEKDSSVKVTGFVEDIWPYVAESAVMINPMRFGAGTQNKVLEAMAIGTPVVTTSMGAEGLDVKAGEELLIADTPEEFANQVVLLMENTCLRDSIRKKARDYVVRNHDWDKIVNHLENIFYEVIKEYKNYR